MQYRKRSGLPIRVATTGTIFLGLTLGYARCHDHKYDSVTQREFYQIFSCFNNTDEITTQAERQEFDRPILELPIKKTSSTSFRGHSTPIPLKVRGLLDGTFTRCAPAEFRVCATGQPSLSTPAETAPKVR